MLNTIPQDPSSVMRFVDGADERQLMSMVSAKNPYSFMALAKLQSIRDAKMKEQAGQPMPPPMSEQIPQQLAQLASGQPMQQQPMQPPMQQPMQPQGIASIGGEPNGAGGGMVSFTDGGGVRRFAEPNGNQLVESQEENFGEKLDAARAALKALPPPPGLAVRGNAQRSGQPDPLDAWKQSQEVLRQGVAEAQANYENKLSIPRAGFVFKPINALSTIAPATPTLTASKADVRNADNAAAPTQEYLRNQLKTPTPNAATPATLTSDQQRFIDAQGNRQFQAINAGAPEIKVPAVADTDKTPSGAGNLNPEPMYKEYQGKLAPLFEKRVDAANAGIAAFETAQKAMSPYYDPKRLAEINPTDAERKALRQAEQADLEKAFPNPYTKTANTLELLQKNLENSEANTFNKALFKASLALMGNKSPRFFQAASEAGLVGVDDYGRMQEANQKQRMALMNADTALATAQDSRKRGLYDQSARQVSESLQFKKDAFLAERDATLEKGKMAIALEGEKAKIPTLKIQQAQDLFTLQHGLFTDRLKIAELNQKGAQIKAMSTPEMGKAIEWAARNPQYAGQIYDEKSRAMFGTIIKEAMEASQKDQVTPPEQKKIVFDDFIKSALEAYAKQYPRPMTFGK